MNTNKIHICNFSTLPVIPTKASRMCSFSALQLIDNKIAINSNSDLNMVVMGLKMKHHERSLSDLMIFNFLQAKDNKRRSRKLRYGETEVLKEDFKMLFNIITLQGFYNKLFLIFSIEPFGILKNYLILQHFIELSVIFISLHSCQHALPINYLSEITMQLII